MENIKMYSNLVLWYNGVCPLHAPPPYDLVDFPPPYTLLRVSSLGSFGGHHCFISLIK